MTDQEKEMLKKAAILFVSLLIFAGISIPIYLLMLAGVKEGGKKEISSETQAVVYEVENHVALTAPTDDAAPAEGQDGENTGDGETAGDGEIVSDEGFTSETASEAPPAGFESPDTDPTMMMPSANPEDQRIEQLSKTGFKLNGFAFFGGILLAMILYAAYFEFVLKKQFYPMMQQEKGALLYALIPFLMFTIIEGVELTLVPLKVTEGYAHFTGIPWELAYVLIVFYMFYTLIGTWLDTNTNRVLDLDGSAFHYNKFGNGPRNLVIIPGLSLMTVEGKGLSMAWMFRMYMKDYTVYVMDKKDNVPKDATIEDLAEDVATAMEKVGIVTADVYGVSMGGMIAQYLTLNHPELVDKLVLCVTASKMNDTIEKYTNHNIMLAKKGDLETVQREGITELFTEAYVKPLKPFLPLLSKLGIPKSNTRFIRLCQAIQTMDAYDRLGEIKCPTYVIGAGKDKVVGTESADELADAIEGSERFIYRNLGHGAYQEAKDINDRILRFLHKPVRIQKDED